MKFDLPNGQEADMRSLAKPSAGQKKSLLCHDIACSANSNLVCIQYPSLCDSALRLVG